MSFDEFLDYITFELEYKSSNNDKTKLFGLDFVYENKDKCKIIYNAKEYKLVEYLEDIDKNYNRNNIIKIQLKINNNITSLNYMFYQCKELLSMREISDFDNYNIFNTNESFFENNSFNLYNDNNLNETE